MRLSAITSARPRRTVHPGHSPRQRVSRIHPTPKHLGGHAVEEHRIKTLTAGSHAPDFELLDQHGSPTRLSQLLRSGPVVVFFYPAAMTMGCTKESCHFRDLKTEFENAGAQRVGISNDTVAKQLEFAERNTFDYPLLSDESGEVALSYGVRRKYVSAVKRATFVIGADQVVTQVVTSELNMDSHADKALEAVAALGLELERDR